MNTYTFKQLGNVHLEVLGIKHLSQVQKHIPRKYLFVALDHASRWAYLELHENRSTIAFIRFLDNLTSKAPFRVQTLSTCNDTAFNDRYANHREGIKEGAETLSQACALHGITLQASPPFYRSAVEQFLRCVCEVFKSEKSCTPKEFKETLLRYVHQYNEHIPQQILGNKTPMEAIRRYLTGE